MGAVVIDDTVDTDKRAERSYKKEDKLLLLSNLVYYTLISVIYSIGVLLARHIPRGLIFSV